MSKIEFLSPCEGEIMNIEKFPDDVFSERALGDGFGVNLTGNKIVAPFDGEVTVMYPSGHAVCLAGDNGVKLMVHVGVETYKLEGLNKTYVKVGDRVKKGDLLIKADVRKMKKKTGNIATAVIFLEGEEVVSLKDGYSAKCLDSVAEIEVKEND